MSIRARNLDPTFLRQLYGAGGNYSISGNTFWVDSNASASTAYPSSGDGTFDRPYITLAQAVSRVTNNKGDVILVKPGHAENIADATTYLWGSAGVDKKGFAVVGLGYGTNRPTFTWTTGTGSGFVIKNPNIQIHNCIFFAGTLDNITACVTIDNGATDTWINGCEFRSDSGADFLVSILLAHASVARTRITNCQFYNDATTGPTDAIKINAASKRTQISDCIFRGAWGTSIIENATTATTDVLITGNYGRNAHATGKLLVLLTASTGIVADNRFGVNTEDGASTTVFDIGSSTGGVMAFENYISDKDAAGGAVAVSGVLTPAAT